MDMQKNKQTFKSFITTRTWWNNFSMEYDIGDMDWAFNRITVTKLKGNKVQLDIDNAYVCDDDNNRGETPYTWFKMILKYDANPYGWVMDTYDEVDRSEKARKRAYIKGIRDMEEI